MGDFRKIKHHIKNINFLLRNILGFKKLVYIVESGWSIEWDGKQITTFLNEQNLIKSRISTTDLFLRNKIIHYGSINTFLDQNGIKNKKAKKSNKIVLTWFHIPSDDMRTKHIPLLNKYADIVHTSCNLTKEKLIGYGLKKEKIVIIPLGIDLSVFKVKNATEKEKIKKKLGLPKNRIIIGSFQKDGVGWGEGLKPKLVKGPDIFLEVVKKLFQKYPLFILLTGPARGYVKNGLEKMGIPYRHDYLKNYYDIVDYYNALDLYLVTSREEGGPKAILESMACGVPLVTTRVGMAPDIIKDGKNGMIADVADIRNIIKKSDYVLRNDKQRKKIIISALVSVKEYDWSKIAQEYYRRIYQKLS